MEENKYYTPEIEEFYVGFECESNVEEIGWQHTVMAAVPEYVEEYLKDGVYRVKYLDKEDIESLGFKSINDTWFVQKEYGDTWQILKTGNITYHISFGQYEYNKVHFEGIIKNKSELEKLMKQLSINEKG